MSRNPFAEVASAIAAAQSSAEASAELLRFAREGQLCDGFAFAENTIADLASALRAAVGIELPRLSNTNRAHGHDAEGVELLRQIDHALFRFLEDWA